MISFIVPTLWKSDYIFESIKSFKENKIDNAEFIIIDNGVTDFSDEELRMLRPTQNIFVNPAWNWGVQVAKNDIVCLLNDDITLNFKTLFNNLEYIKKHNFGVIGLHGAINIIQELNNDDDELKLIESSNRWNGFGCMMILKKQNYKLIPEELKIFWGDVWLDYYCANILGLKSYHFENLKCKGDYSVTSKEYSEFDQKEMEIFNNHLRFLN